jgi:hypothetical protein
MIPALGSLELSGMLINDACAKHVCHVQNLLMYFVKRGNVRSPIALKPRDDFLGRQVQMVVHHLSHFGLRPTFGISPAVLSWIC